MRREVPKGKHQAFWYAYRKHGSRLVKTYVGKTETLTLARLATAAQQLDRLRGPQSAGPA